MSSVMFCKGEELGFTVIRFAPERIVRTIIIFPAMYFGDRQSSKLEDGRILKNSFVRRAEAIMSFLSKRISFGIPVEPDVCPMTWSWESYHSCRKELMSGSTLFLSVSRFLCWIPLSLILIPMTFRMKFEINPSLPVGYTGWSSRFVPGAKVCYSCRVVLSPVLESSPWGDAPGYSRADVIHQPI